jgi:hypothetical protein
MNTGKISDFSLERYKLGELLPEELKAMDELLAKDVDLSLRLKNLDDSDEELRTQFPAGLFVSKLSGSGKFPLIAKRRPLYASGRRKLIGLSAVFILCVLFPVFFFMRNNSSAALNDLPGTGIESAASPQDRAKGMAVQKLELYVFLKGDMEKPLSDQTQLAEGNTVQIAYTVPSGEYYGVIFSIDGRSIVTLHYPYRKEQSSLLVSGKRTFLEEAYTLDDAPNYEVFVMLLSHEPLDAGMVLREAQRMAETENFLSPDINSADGKTLAFEKMPAFKEYEVETIKVCKR